MPCRFTPESQLFPHHPAVEARQLSPDNIGLVAARDLRAGEPIIIFDLLQPQDFVLAPLDQTFGDCMNRGASFAPGVFFCPSSQHPFFYFNHSCAKNCGFVSYGRIEHGRIAIAPLVDLPAGTHLTIDYADITTPDEGSPDGDPWIMECWCHEPNCRHIVSGFDSLCSALQALSLEQQAVLAYIAWAHRPDVRNTDQVLAWASQQIWSVLLQSENPLLGQPSAATSRSAELISAKN